jgi:hypothetical protein
MNANPEGVEFPSLSMFNPFMVGSPFDHNHGFRLPRHQRLFKLISSGMM